MLNQKDSSPRDELQELLESVRRRLRKLTIAVLMLILAVMLCAAAIFGNLLNYFGNDSMHWWPR